MDLLLKAQTNQEDMADDDPQVSYLISAWARICKIMGKRFEPYLPLVMGPVLKTASLKPEVIETYYKLEYRNETKLHTHLSFAQQIFVIHSFLFYAFFSIYRLHY